MNNSSVQLNNHDIPEYCPSDEVECYQVTLEKRDLVRIFILYQSGFLYLTNNNTFKVSDLIVTTARKIDRVQSFLNDETFDLRSRPDHTIILFGKNLDTSLLTAMDGNHRLKAHYIEHENIDGIPAFNYLCNEPRTVILGCFLLQILISSKFYFFR